MSVSENRQRAGFTKMQDGNAEDWAIIGAEYFAFAERLADRILAHLKLLSGDYGGFPVDRLEHSLQTATLAHQAGEDEQYVVCALLHDIGDTLGSHNHADVAASILQPFVCEENHWMIQKHGIFQGYYFFHFLGMDRDLREQFRGHPCFGRTAEFCEKYDTRAFDPAMKATPLEFFEPMVRRVFAKPKQTLYRLEG